MFCIARFKGRRPKHCETLEMIPKVSKGSQLESKGYQKWAKGLPKCIKLWRETNDCQTTAGIQFWRHFVDFGSHFGAHWILKGSPNRQFPHQINIRSQKWVSRKASWKNMFLDGCLMTKCEALWSKSNFVLYLMQFNGFGGSWNLMKNGSQKVIQNHPKSEPLAPKGRTFYDLLFFGCVILGVFWGAAKSRQKVQPILSFWPPNPKAWYSFVGLAECAVLL